MSWKPLQDNLPLMQRALFLCHVTNSSSLNSSLALWSGVTSRNSKGCHFLSQCRGFSGKFICLPLWRLRGCLAQVWRKVDYGCGTGESVWSIWPNDLGNTANCSTSAPSDSRKIKSSISSLPFASCRTRQVAGETKRIEKSWSMNRNTRLAQTPSRKGCGPQNIC